MKFFITLFLTLFSLILFSCEKTDNSVSLTEHCDGITPISSKPTIIPTQYGFEISQSIDGTSGGSIIFDTTYVNNEADTVTFNFDLKFLPNSFMGVKEIRIIPNFDSIFVKFYPSMLFNKPAFLDLSYKGIDLTKLGFDSNTKVDFAFLDENGLVEYILNQECKIKWSTKQVYVKSAKLSHFSRYSFIRKNL